MWFCSLLLTSLLFVYCVAVFVLFLGGLSCYLFGKIKISISISENPEFGMDRFTMTATYYRHHYQEQCVSFMPTFSEILD